MCLLSRIIYQKTAKIILDMLNTEVMAKVHVAYGTIVSEIKDVSRSYKEAKMALDVGRIFYGNRNVIAYSNLGIGRLIYQLPIPLCKMFIKEIFGDKYSVLKLGMVHPISKNLVSDFASNSFPK